jgi:hypothetical protein
MNRHGATVTKLIALILTLSFFLLSRASDVTGTMQGALCYCRRRRAH